MHKSNLIRGSALTITLLYFQTTLIADDELLVRIVNSHMSSRGALQSCECKVEFVNDIVNSASKSNTTQKFSSECWYKDGISRVRSSYDNQVEDAVWRNSSRETIITRIKNGQPKVAVTRQPMRLQYTHRSDAFVRGLLVLNNPGTVDYVTFESLLRESTGTPQVSTQTNNGIVYAVVKMQFESKRPRIGKWAVEVTFDPSVNYLVRKVTYSCIDQPNRLIRSEEVSEFAEFPGGNFFPTIIHGYFGSEGYESKMTTKINNVKINHKIPESVFMLNYTNGAMVVDASRETIYKVDSKGNRTSEEKKLIKTSPPPQASQGVQAGSSAFGSETESEPQGYSRWIAPVSGIVLVVALVLAYFQRKARRQLVEA